MKPEDKQAVALWRLGVLGPLASARLEQGERQRYSCCTSATPRWPRWTSTARSPAAGTPEPLTLALVGTEVDLHLALVPDEPAGAGHRDRRRAGPGRSARPPARLAARRPPCAQRATRRRPHPLGRLGPHCPAQRRLGALQRSRSPRHNHHHAAERQRERRRQRLKHPRPAGGDPTSAGNAGECPATHTESLLPVPGPGIRAGEQMPRAWGRSPLPHASITANTRPERDKSSSLLRAGTRIVRPVACADRGLRLLWVSR